MQTFIATLKTCMRLHSLTAHHNFRVWSQYVCRYHEPWLSLSSLVKRNHKVRAHTYTHIHILASICCLVFTLTLTATSVRSSVDKKNINTLSILRTHVPDKFAHPYRHFKSEHTCCLCLHVRYKRQVQINYMYICMYVGSDLPSLQWQTPHVRFPAPLHWMAFGS